MAKAGGQLAIWYCPECKRGNYIFSYIKRRNDEIVKVLSKFCAQCQQHTDHTRKDSKKAQK